MSSKEVDCKDSKYDFKSEGKGDDAAIGEDFAADAKSYMPNPPKINITSIEIDPATGEISEAFRLRIMFELDRDCVAATWCVKFLVDSGEKRVIKILGETKVEDYPDGDSEMEFFAESIDVSGIPSSTLANSGLLMATFNVDGEEVASVNMVVNVTKRGDQFYREILSPLD